MNVEYLFRTRFSARQFTTEDVDDMKLRTIICDARLAPSAANKQPWHFFIVRNEPILSEVKKCYHRDWTKNAPCMIVVCGNKKESWKRQDGKDFLDIDLAIVCDHLTFAVTDMGYATCWICNFDVEALTKVLELKEDMIPFAMFPVGYTDLKPELYRHTKERKYFEQIATWK